MKKIEGHFGYPVPSANKFGTKYFKTHVKMVISKFMTPTPQLDIKFYNP